MNHHTHCRRRNMVGFCMWSWLKVGGFSETCCWLMMGLEEGGHRLSVARRTAVVDRHWSTRSGTLLRLPTLYRCSMAVPVPCTKYYMLTDRHNKSLKQLFRVTNFGEARHAIDSKKDLSQVTVKSPDTVSRQLPKSSKQQRSTGPFPDPN